MIFGYKPNTNYLPNIIWLVGIFNYSVATLQKTNKQTTTNNSNSIPIPAGSHCIQFSDRCRSARFCSKLIFSGRASRLFLDKSRHSSLERCEISGGRSGRLLLSSQSSWSRDSWPMSGG